MTTPTKSQQGAPSAGGMQPVPSDTGRRKQVSGSAHRHRLANAALYRAIAISVMAILLTALSFHGALDEFARTQVTETTNESVAIYLISQGINALVSVLQTSQVNVPLIASAQVGEMLDPVNDAIERLSSVVVWAIGSLFLQRILLEISSSPAFQWILCSLGLVTMATLLLLEWERFRVVCRDMLNISDVTAERSRNWLVQMFVMAVIFRFVIPVFIAVSFLVSQLFLGEEIADNKERLSLLSAQVSTIGSMSSPDVQNLGEQKAREEARLNALDAAMDSFRQEARQLEETIDALNDETGMRRFLPERFGGVSPGGELVSSKERREAIEREIEKIEIQIDVGRENLDCIERQIVGETCDSFLEKMSKAGKAGISNAKEVFRKANDFVTDITMLLAAVAIKNILFPLLFLMLAVKCSLPIALYVSKRLSSFERDSKKLKNRMADMGDIVDQVRGARPRQRLEKRDPDADSGEANHRPAEP